MRERSTNRQIHVDSNYITCIYIYIQLKYKETATSTCYSVSFSTFLSALS